MTNIKSTYIKEYNTSEESHKEDIFVDQIILKNAQVLLYDKTQVYNNPQLQKLLQTVYSVNLTNKEHYLAFDKALKTYSVKYIKQNITSNLADQEMIMSKIKATQNEKNRLLMLLEEYIDDVVVSQNSYTIKLYKDSLWLLATKLSSTFNYPNPKIHHLFENVPKISKN
ncbi:9235_t:CDS:2, partial [Cetraspora pellucida]